MPYVHVKVEEGELRGMESAGVTSFLGVPYGVTSSPPPGT